MTSGGRTPTAESTPTVRRSGRLLAALLIVGMVSACVDQEPRPSDAGSVASGDPGSEVSQPESSSEPNSTQLNDDPDQPAESDANGQEPEREPEPPPLAATLTSTTTGASGDLTESGRVVTTHDGQVIEDLRVIADADVNAALVIEHNDVLVRNVHVVAPGSTAGIRIESDVSGTRIEHATVDGTRAEYGDGRADANWGNEGILAYSPVNVTRCHIFDVRQGIQLWSGATGSSIVENYISEVWRNAPGVSTTAISYRGSSRDNGVTRIMRNRVTTSGMGGLSISAREGPVRNVAVLDNVIAGTFSEQSSSMQTGYAIRGGYDGRHRESNENVRIEGNRFDGDFEWGSNGAVNPDQPGNTFVDNRWTNGATDESAQRTLRGS